MQRSFRSLLVAALALPGVLAAQTGSTVRVDYVEETLPNGLKVVYAPDPSIPIAAVVVWYDVGSKHEQPGRTGFAHLFEHIMFKGSRNVADGQHFGLLEDAGARAGADINGTTSWDRTNYFEQVPSNQLELALWLEADRMGTLLETLTEEKLENQRQVVMNERRQGVDNQPYGTWFERMAGHAFPEGHPYRHPVIGSMDDLAAATLDDVRSFFRTYYAPNNAVLVIAGDIDVENARMLVRRHFGWIPSGPAPPPLRSAAVPERLGTTVREVVGDANARAPAVFIGFRAPAAGTDQAEAVSLLASTLSARSGRLYAALVREQQIATNVGVFNFGMQQGSDLLVVNAMGKPGASADSLEAALLAELESIGATIDQEALDRARSTQRFQFVSGLQRTGGFGGRADLIAAGWTYRRNAGWLNGQLERDERVTVADLQRLVRERLVPDNRIVLVFVPETSAPANR
jgi:zinc protease